MAAKRPTILEIIPELDTGGAELSTIEIASAIVNAGGRALVASEGGRLAPRLAAAGAEFVPFPAATKNPARIIWNARALARLIRDEGIDLIDVHSRAPAWSALLAARKTHTPLVTTYHGAYSENGAIKRAYNRVMASGDLVIANSGYTRDLIEARYGTPRSKIRVIYRGVDGTLFDPKAVSPARIADLAKAWGVAAGTRIVLQAARLTSWKGQAIVIEAARRLAASGRLGETVIVMAGSAQGRTGYEDELKAAIRDARLETRVRLVGHVEDMAAAYALAHTTVVASTKAEAFGMSVTEAQAMGCPVIATGIGAPPETILAAPPSDRTGWLVPPGDADALAEALAEALALSPAERQALGHRARLRAVGTFGMEAMRRETLAAYSELLGPGFTPFER